VLLIGAIMYVYPPLLYMGWAPGPAGALGVPQRRRPDPEVAGAEPEEPEPPAEHAFGTPPIDPDFIDETEPPAAMV
jgi:hypothetical protein